LVLPSEVFLVTTDSISHYIASITLGYDTVKKVIESQAALRHDLRCIDAVDLRCILADPFAHLDAAHIEGALPSIFSLRWFGVEHIGRKRVSIEVVIDSEHFESLVNSHVTGYFATDDSIHPERLINSVQGAVLKSLRVEDINQLAHDYIESRCYAITATEVTL
jgi:hypothetical protein